LTGAGLDVDADVGGLVEADVVGAVPWEAAEAEVDGAADPGGVADAASAEEAPGEAEALDAVLDAELDDAARCVGRSSTIHSDSGESCSMRMVEDS